MTQAGEQVAALRDALRRLLTLNEELYQDTGISTHYPAADFARACIRNSTIKQHREIQGQTQEPESDEQTRLHNVIHRLHNERDDAKAEVARLTQELAWTETLLRETKP